MTKTLAVSWARDGIRVNAVAPGVIESNMTAPMMAYEPITGPLLARTPMGRFGTPEDIAPAVLFLASPRRPVRHRPDPGRRRRLLRPRLRRGRGNDHEQAVRIDDLAPPVLNDHQQGAHRPSARRWPPS